MKTKTYPPYLKPNDCVILFDGVCKLCNAWSRFVIRFDKKWALKLSSVQSVEGQAILEHFDLPTDYFETILYVENGECFEKSEAFFKIMSKLGMPWVLACLFRIVPLSLRDWAYDRVALNRYRLFGKYDQCLLPTADHNARFL